MKKHTKISYAIICLFSITGCASSSSYTHSPAKSPRAYKSHPIVFSPTGEILAKAEDKSILLTEPFTGSAIKKLRTGKSKTILSLAFTPDGRYLAAGSYRKISVWDMELYKMIKTVNAHEDYVTSLAFSIDGAILASGSKGVDRTISFWDTTEWNHLRSLERGDDYQYAAYIRSMAFSPDGRYFAATGLDRAISVWNVITGRRVNVIKNSAVINSLAFSRDSKTVVTGDMENNIRVWSVADGKNIKTINGGREPVISVAFNNKGDYLATAGYRTLRLWDTTEWQYKNELIIKKSGAGIAFSKDLLFVAALNQGGDISYYRLLTGIAEDTPTVPGRGIAPIVSIITPPDQSTVRSEKVRIAGKARDDTGIKEITFIVNNVLLSGDSRDLVISPAASSGKTRSFEIDVPLIKGENRITVSVLDIDGFTSSETITISRIAQEREIWGAVIGISRYEKVNNLKYADRDAEEFYKYLNEDYGIPEDHIFSLTNEEATNKNVRDLLGVKLKRAAGRNDTVIIYYAGHGASELDDTSPDGDGLEKYLLPFDADPESLYSTALPMADISKILGWIKAERVVFISDTCYSGASDIRSGRTILTTRRPRALSNVFLDRISSGKGRVILTASEANEVSIEDDDLRHGVFTYYLLKALKGAGDKDGDGLITVDEAYSYITEKVPEATGQTQHPVKKGDVTGEIIIGRVR